MAYIPFTNEQLIRANSVDLVEFLRLKGEKLEKCGKEHKLVYTDSYGKHDSIMIHGSTWFDHKNQVGGGAIKFMQQFYGLSFPIAVQTLLGKECEQPVHKPADDITEKEKAEFRLPPENKTMYRVFAYLTKQRFIAGSVVSHFAHAHTLYEDAQHHNAVFVGLDEEGMPKQASRRSTTSFGISFKGTCEGSDTKYSFADKEMVIPFNPASKATPPRAKKTKVNYFEFEEIKNIIKCLKTEPLKWQVLVNLLIITGARRGEIVGLKWDAVDWENNRIFIHVNLLYSAEKGIYEDTTKTLESERYITLPEETIELLKAYRKWYIQTSSDYGSRWTNTGFLFVQERNGTEGKPMHPDSVNIWLRSFAKRHGLGHINPHAFRHTMASLLLHSNMDIASISKRLGHAKISTTLDIYSHILKDSDPQSAEKIAEIVLRKELA